MDIDGNCHCGRITFEAKVDPAKVRMCHCTDCQTLSGSPFRVMVRAKAEDFRLLTGAPKIYLKTAENGRQRQQAFCGECGTPIYATSVDDVPDFYGIRIGSVRQRDQLIPKRQIWHCSAQSWLGEIEGIAKVETQ